MVTLQVVKNVTEYRYGFSDQIITCREGKTNQFQMQRRLVLPIKPGADSQTTVDSLNYRSCKMSTNFKIIMERDLLYSSKNRIFSLKLFTFSQD